MRRGALDRPARLQTSADRQPPRRPRIEPSIGALIRRIGANRDGDVECATDLETEEAGGRDANHFGRMGIERDGPPECGSLATELALPERITDDGAGRATAAPVVSGREEPAERRLNAEHVEEIAAHPQCPRIPHLSARREVERAIAPGEDAGQRLLFGTKAFPDRIRDRRSPC